MDKQLNEQDQKSRKEGASRHSHNKAIQYALSIRGGGVSDLNLVSSRRPTHQMRESRKRLCKGKVQKGYF